MFWKKIEKSKKNINASSIVRNITVFSTLSASLILVLSVGFLYWTLQDNFEKKDARFLLGEISELQSLLSENSVDWTEVEKEIKGEEITRAKLNPYYIRLIGYKHDAVIETQGMAKALPGYVFPEPEHLDAYGRGKEWQAENGSTFLLVSVSVNGGNKSDKYILQSAIDISQDEIILNDYRNKIFLVFLFGIILSAGINIYVSRRGLRPLNKITDKVHQITAGQLHERIQTENWPKELSVLATAFDEMLNRLEDSFNRLSQFSVNLAHELRTPINNLIGEASVALSKDRTSEEYRQILESGLEEYSRLSRMIEQLLFLARSENNQIKLEIVTFGVRSEIETVIDFYDAVAQEQEVRVIYEGEALLKADIVLFRRLINNLLSNALQYTPRGGNVAVSAQSMEGQGVEIIVKDTGMGINENDLPQLFNRFFRTESAQSHHPHGMGLGLHIVKSIMTLHGGTVLIQSSPSQGTAVILKFPQA